MRKIEKEEVRILVISFGLDFEKLFFEFIM